MGSEKVVDGGYELTTEIGSDGRPVIYRTLMGPDGQPMLRTVVDDVADLKAHIAARNLRSSDDFFGEKNRLKRSEAITKRMERFLKDTVEPTIGGPKFRTISDKSFIELMAHPEEWEEMGFKPVKNYPAGLFKIRPLYKGEVGIVEKAGQETYFLVLEAGFGKGTIVSNG